MSYVFTLLAAASFYVAATNTTADVPAWAWLFVLSLLFAIGGAVSWTDEHK